MNWSTAADIGTTVAALAACLAVAVAVWAAMKHTKMARAHSSLEFVSKLENDWFSVNGQQLRARAATNILAEKASNSKAVYDFLLTLERIGLLVETHALDPEIVWSELSSTILNYYPACRTAIEDYQQNNQLAWYNFTLLHRRMQRIERDRGGSEVDPTYEKWKRHLNGDIDLVARNPEGETSQ